jgi:hypothetical protein
MGGEGDDVVLGLDIPHPHQAVRRPSPQDETVRVELRVAAYPPKPTQPPPPPRADQQQRSRQARRLGWDHTHGFFGG